MEGETDFLGIRLDTARAKLPPGYFQEDQGGDRFENGTWKRRRGMRRTDIAIQGTAVTSIIGFELPGEGFGLMLAEGVDLWGFTDVAQLVDTIPDGFGTGGFGVGGFGA